MLNQPLILALLLLAVLMFWAIGAYNRLMGLRDAIAEAWRQIDEPLKRRHELLPELLRALREPLHTEHRALDAVLAASEQTIAAAASVRPHPGEIGAVASLVLAEQVLAAALARLRALLDQQPALLTDERIAAHLQELSVLDQRMQFRRQLFNQAAHHYNEAVHQFPTNMLVPLFRFGASGTL